MTVLMTGFPGLLGSALLPRILEGTDGTAVCLVQPKYADLAERRLAELTGTAPSVDGRIRLVLGDITMPGLGLDETSIDLADISEIWHLAAVYDVNVERDLAVRVNVEGTRYVLDVAERCRALERMHYFSTCYVSGRYAGAFGEDDLEVGAPFSNYYEETKHRAEADVRARMSQGLPATIYRPSIVAGDSRTGETQKFDGPYFFIQLLLRQPGVAILPLVGEPTVTRVNVVPRDFAIDAIAHLSGLAESRGRCYHIADPSPLTVDEMIDVIAAATGRKVVRVPLPRSAAKAALHRVPGADKVVRIPPPLIDYMVHPTYYLYRPLTGRARRQRHLVPAVSELCRKARRVHARTPRGDVRSYGLTAAVGRARARSSVRMLRKPQRARSCRTPCSQPDAGSGQTA